MAEPKTGYLRFKSPSGEEVERPQEETQSLRRAGFTPSPGQSLLVRGSGGDVQRIPVERLSRIAPSDPLAIPSARSAFEGVAEERFGGAGGAALAGAYGLAQGVMPFTGYALQKTGAVSGETLGMLQQAHPYITTGAEMAGMVAAPSVFGAIGKAAKIGRGAALAGEAAAEGAAAAEAAGAAAKTAPSLLRRVGTEAASLGAYSVGSEMTQAGIEGREARPVEAGLMGATLGAAGAALAPQIARGFGKVKSLVVGQRAAKLAEDEAGLAAARAKAQARLDSAKTAKEMAAARAELKSISDIEKKAEKLRATEIENDVARRVDEEIVNQGDKAQQALDAHKAKIEGDVNASLNKVNDALKTANEAGESLRRMGLPMDPASAEATLLQRMNKLANSYNEIGEEIAANGGIVQSLDKLSAAKSNSIEFTRIAESELANRKALIERASNAYRAAKAAGQSEATLARLEGRLKEAQAASTMIEQVINASYEQIEASLAYTEAATAGNRIAGAVGVADEAVAKSLAKQEAIDNQLRKIIPTEMRVPTSAAASAEDVVEATARRMGLTPEIDKIVPEFTSGITTKLVGLMKADSVAGVLKSASRMGPEKFLEVIERLPTAEGILVGGKKAAAKAGDVFKWLARNDAAIAALEPHQRSALREILSGSTYEGAGKAREAVLKNMPILSSTAKATPLKIAETEIAAAMEREAGNIITPEMAYSARDMGRIGALQAERAQAGSVVANVSAVSDALNDQLVAANKASIELGKQLETANASLRTAKDASKLRSLKAREESLRAQKDVIDQNIDRMSKAQMSLSAAIGSNAPVEQLRAQAAAGVANAQIAMQSARNAEKMARRVAKREAIGTELEQVTQNLREVMQVNGISERMTAANEIISAASKDLEGAAKIERDRITNSFYAPGQKQVVEKLMADYMKTPEGKHFAAQVASAGKARMRQMERGIEEKARAAAGVGKDFSAEKKRVIDAMSDPAVIAATVTGGLTSGASVLAAMVASQSGKGGVRKLISALSPMWAFTALERAASFGEKMASSRVGPAVVGVTAEKLGEVSRRDVAKATAELDDIVKDQVEARRAFRSAADATQFPGDKFGPLEKQYADAVGELQRMRPKTLGKGPPSAEEEEFVKAMRVISDPMTLATAFQTGSISKSQADILRAVSPSAYENLKGIISATYEAAPHAVRPRVMQAFNISAEMPGTGMSVGSAQRVMAATGQPTPEPSLGTARPPTSKNSGIANSASLVGQKP